jgi:sec-independent protein translocase protein TatB
VFNLQGSELIIILLLALVVLGPEKLPDAMRKLGELYGQLKKMSSGFQQEFRAATQEPVREIRETANTLRDSVDFRKLSTGEREEKPKSAEMAPATPIVPTVAPADPDAVPTTDVPFTDTDPDDDSAAGAASVAGAESGPVDVDVPAEPASASEAPVDVAPAPASASETPVDVAPEPPPVPQQNEGP